MVLKPTAALYDKGGNNYEFLWEAKESQRSPSKLLPNELLISQLMRCRAALQSQGKQGASGTLVLTMTAPSSDI